MNATQAAVFLLLHFKIPDPLKPFSFLFSIAREDALILLH